MVMLTIKSSVEGKFGRRKMERTGILRKLERYRTPWTAEQRGSSSSVVITKEARPVGFGYVYRLWRGGQEIVLLPDVLPFWKSSICAS